jgi:hypothetical protein
MGGLLAGLVSLATPILARVLVSLGMSVVTITGVSLVLSSLKSQIVSYAGSAPLAMLQLIGLSGGWEALGIIFGAMTFAGTYWSLTQATKLLGSS